MFNTIAIPALYSTLFPNDAEAAFSNYRVCEALGLCIGMSYSSFLCTDIKLYILVTFLLLGMLGYGLVEWREKMKKI